MIMKFINFLILICLTNYIHTQQKFISSDFNKVIYPEQSTNQIITITEPGSYILRRDIEANPSTDSSAIITISANNVGLNLNGKTVTVTSTNTQQNITGIKVEASKTNVTIFNGHIYNCNGKGIDIETNCNNIFISNSTINKCCSGGILMNTTLNSIISYCLIDTCSPAAADAFGCKLINCKNIKIESCDFNNNDAPTGYNAYGILLDNCKSCEVYNCSCNGNTGDNAYGICLKNNSSSCYFENCNANDNAASNGYVSGFAVLSGKNNWLDGCQASNNIGTTNAYGFYFYSSEYNISNNCKGINQNSSSTGNAYGFYSTAGSGNRFENSNAIGNTAGNSASAIGAGFALENSETNSIIDNCKSLSNDGGNSGIGYGIKFGDSGQTITNCIVTNNLLSGNKGNKKYGFKDFTSQSTAVLKNNIASGHGSILPLDITKIKDNGKQNYMVNFTGASKPTNIIHETDNANINTLNEKTPWINISLS